jgi:dTDP-glucose 4,6-dehydratase
MKTVLITGVSGFIGSHLAHALSRRYDVFGTVKYSTSRNLQALQQYLAGTTLVRCDIADYQSVSFALKSVNPDVVIHLAALSPVRDSFENPFTYVHANVHGTLNIAHAMLELPDAKNKKLIYASTAEVYGMQTQRPIREDAVLNPSSPYANTKSMTDTYLRMMTSVYGLNTTVMRCTNTFGRKLETGFYVEYVVTTMLRGEKVYVGAPESTRDYMYVTDHVNAYIAAMEHSEVKGEAFNVTPGGEISNRDLALQIADLLGYDSRQIVFGKYPPHYPLRPLQSDQPFIDLDATKVRTMLGWKPSVTFEDGLALTIDYWRQRISPREDRGAPSPVLVT